jgi:hypothetical protein
LLSEETERTDSYEGGGGGGIDVPVFDDDVDDEKDDVAASSHPLFWSVLSFCVLIWSTSPLGCLEISSASVVAFVVELEEDFEVEDFEVRLLGMVCPLLLMYDLSH